MKKILYIVSTLQKCGPINQLSYIVKYLDKSNFEPVVLTLSEEINNSMQDYFMNVLNIRVETLHLSRLKSLFLAKKYILQFIKKNNIDLVHTQGIRADRFMSKITMPRVATLRNYPYDDYPMTYGRVKGNIMAHMHLRYLKKITYPVVVSESVSKMLWEEYQYKIDFVRNGIDREKFKPKDKKILRKKLSLPRDKNIFISVGYLSERKNPLLIIETFKKSTQKDQVLIFLGNGKLKEKCVENANKNILFVGNVDNVNDYLAASDYLVSASYAEGFPNTVLESLAMHRPAILSDIPPHLELYSLNNDATKIFGLEDSNALLNIFNKIEQYNSQKLEIACEDIVTKYLDCKIMVQNYQNIYTKLLDMK